MAARVISIKPPIIPLHAIIALSQRCISDWM